MNEEEYIDALITLHGGGLRRQGPGDEVLAREILAALPRLPASPRIADLGCGAGAGTLLLAEYFRVRVRAVDFAPAFLDDLVRFAAERGLADLVEPIRADMGALDWEPGSLDLLWSEGAAYVLTFAGALEAWRPLLADGGIAVISEITWLSDDPPKEAAEFWGEGYPPMAGVGENRRRAEVAGFEVLSTHRLPSPAWWDGYYDPLRERMETLRDDADENLLAVMAETEREMELFRRHSESYGYVFYVLRAR
ncbi:MAG: methyltransferase domain-containing protein [Planctomycetota bacterium]